MTERNTANLEPDEQFIDGLEQQLREGIRRRARLDPTDHASGRIQRKGTNVLATLSLMTLSLVLGVTGTFAVVHQDFAPHRELHLQRAAILLELAEVRLEQRQFELAELQSAVEQGLVGESVAARSRQKVTQAKSQMQRRELDLKETRITGRAPVDDLSGPLIDGEDFVTQRLVIQHEPLEHQLQRVQAEFSRTEQLAERGIISERELSLARADVKEAELTLARLQERIELRRSFIDGEMAAEEIELLTLVRDTEAEYTIALARLSSAQMTLRRMTALHERGAVTSGELRAARTEAREAESNLALAEVQLKMIRQRLEAFEQEA